MSGVERAANVYFLPAVPAAPEPLRAPSPWRRLRARFTGVAWRVRYAIAGIRLALRRPRTPLFVDDDTMTIFADHRAELIQRKPRMAPARVIDFSSARERLRPLAAR